MMRRDAEDTPNRRSDWTTPSTSQISSSGSAAPAPVSPAAQRVDTLSPDAAKLGDTHTRTSRFLRKSRSKQHLSTTMRSTNTESDQGRPIVSPTLQQGLGSDNKDTDFLPSRTPAYTPASPAKQPTRASTMALPLSGGDRQQPTESPQKGNSSDSGRSVGAWFSSMLSASQAASQSHQRRDDDTASVRSFATVATSPSRLLHRKSAQDSPSRRSTLTHSTNGSHGVLSSTSPSTSRPVIGKMGGFDRMFDRALQFFTDSDSNVDRCPDDIWLLGVRHQGWRPEQDAPAPSTSRSPSSRPSLETLNSDSYFHVGESNNLPRPPSTRQLVTSGRRRLSKSSNRTASSGDAATPPTLEIPSSPSRIKAAAFFTSRKGTTSDSAPSSQLLERTTSSSSSSSSAARSERSGSKFSVTPAVVGGLPVSFDDKASIYTFSTETPGLSQQASLPMSSVQTYGWPPAFYHDFYSRIQLTYRSGFSPLPNSIQAGPSNSVATAFSSMMTNLNASIGRSMSMASLGDTQPATGLSSDAGWGCMLRTGQSLLANALMDVHLGRDFRRPLPANQSNTTHGSSFGSLPEYAAYVRLISWFFDDPSSLSPFSIHKFALEGKKLGKQIGEWFGRSTAAGAIKVLANDFAPANLGVALAIDTTVYGSEVFHIAKGDALQGWNRPVLILVPLRLGLNGVNPIYYSSLQHYFTLPQCVGIAGGRPSSSYYFVGSQGSSLFYIDPHHTKPTIKAVTIPERLQRLAHSQPMARRDVSSPLSTSHNQEYDELSAFFANAYGPKELESFHCEKVRKMSLAALDPSMLVGLLCQSQADWDDLCHRMRSFPSSKEHQPIINIVQEMPAWMRKSSRSISGAGLNASGTSQRSPQQAALGRSTASTAPAKAQERAIDDLEGSSVDYADSDDWDIDDSDDDDMGNQGKDIDVDEGEDDSLVVKPASPSFQEINPSSFDSDEPDYRDRKNGRSPLGRSQALPPAIIRSEPSSPGEVRSFDENSIMTGQSPPTPVSPATTTERVDADAVLVSPPRVPPKASETRMPSLDPEEKEAGWGSL